MWDCEGKGLVEFWQVAQDLGSCAKVDAEPHWPLALITNLYEYSCLSEGWKIISEFKNKNQEFYIFEI